MPDNKKINSEIVKEKKSSKKFINLFFKILVSAVLLYFLFNKIDRDVFIRNFSKLDLMLVPLVIILLILNYVVSSVRWKALLVFEDSEKISVEYLTYLYFIGSFFNNFMPTSIGGDVYKIYKLGKKMHNNVSAFAATFMERFTGVIVLFLISIISMFWFFHLLSVLALAWFVIGLLFGIEILKFLSNRISFIKKIYDSLMIYKGKNKVIFWALITSLAVQFLAILTQYTIFIALGINVSFVYSLLVLPLITLASFIIPSLNGVGVQDALYVAFFGYVGINSELALSASILYHLFRLGVSLIGGVLYAMGKAD